MEWDFTFRRTLLFASCVVVFWFLGGFSVPGAAEGNLDNSGRFHGVWFRSVAMFLAGAGACSFIEHFVGTVDRTNIRFVYVLGGIAAMILALLMQHSMRVATAG